MLRATILLCLAVTLGWASPVGKASVLSTDPEINPDLFEGDIMGIDSSKNAIIDTSLLWPNGIVYYNIGQGFSAEEVATLMEAFNEYETKSCIRFVDRTTERDFVQVRKTGGGCYSYIGRVGGLQTLSLDAGCFRCTATGCLPGTPIHEFYHALGFYHEQSRTDRDDYVTINWSNIQPGKENNFNKYDTDVIQDLGTKYDYGSVMHYGAYGFAIDPTVPTIITPNGEEIGQRIGFSANDLLKLNRLYNCTGFY